MVFEMAFRARKVSETFQKRAPGGEGQMDGPRLGGKLRTKGEMDEQTKLA